MNYHDNKDELQRMQNRRQTRRPPVSGGAVPRPKANSRLERSRTETFDPIDDAYFEEEYGYDDEGDGLNIPFSDPVSSKTQSFSAQRTGEQYRRQTAGSGRGSRTPVRNVQAKSAGQRRASQYSRETDSGQSRASSRTVQRVSQTGSSRKSASRRTAVSERAAVPKGGQRTRSGNPRPRKSKRRKKWPAILLVLLIAFTAYGGWLFLHKPTGTWTVAVFGVDSRDGNTKKALADVQMICTLDWETGEIRLVSVYRDTYLKIDSKGTYHKINEAYFKGGQKQAVDALAENLDLDIDDYATFNWKAVAEAINVLGGIDLEITPAEFKYINAFITETVNSTGLGSVQLKQAGPNHLDGVQAVAYCRLRLMDTDFQRTERQRKVITLALEKARQADAATLTSLAKAILPQISTSVGIDDVLPLVKDISRYHIADTAGFPFSRETKRVGKMDCVIPTTLESNVIQLHHFLYGENTLYSPSSAVKKISAHISEETGLYEEGKAAPSSSSGKNSSGSGSSGKQTESSQKATQPSVPETSTSQTEESAEKEETASTEETTETVNVKESEKETEETEKEEEKSENWGPGNNSGDKTDSSDKTEPTSDINHSVPNTDGPSETHSGTNKGPGESSGSGISSNGPGSVSDKENTGNNGPGGSSSQSSFENSGGPGV